MIYRLGLKIEACGNIYASCKVKGYRLYHPSVLWSTSQTLPIPLQDYSPETTMCLFEWNFDRRKGDYKSIRVSSPQDVMVFPCKTL